MLRGEGSSRLRPWESSPRQAPDGRALNEMASAISKGPALRKQPRVVRAHETKLIRQTEGRTPVFPLLVVYPCSNTPHSAPHNALRIRINPNVVIRVARVGVKIRFIPKFTAEVIFDGWLADIGLSNANCSDRYLRVQIATDCLIVS